MGQAVSGLLTACTCDVEGEGFDDVPLLPPHVLLVRVFPYLLPADVLRGVAQACRGWRYIVRSSSRTWLDGAFIAALPAFAREDLILTWTARGAKDLLWLVDGDSESGCRADLMFRPLTLKCGDAASAAERIAGWFDAHPHLRREPTLRAWVGLLGCFAPEPLELWLATSHWTDSCSVTTDRLVELRLHGCLLGSLRMYHCRAGVQRRGVPAAPTMAVSP